MSAASHGKTPYYFVPHPSSYPFLAAVGIFFIVLGAGQWVNGHQWGSYSLMGGLLWLLYVLKKWFGLTIRESEGGMYSERIETSFRWSMAWFIFSEVMFFSAFFGALYWIRAHSVPNLGSLENSMLWPDFKAVWPSVVGGLGATASPANTIEAFTTMGPLPIPTINTAILLSSGVTLTLAHHALRADHRATCIRWMWLTVLLGVTFLSLQVYEYHHAYTELNLKLSSGVYGSTFFMLTGFHGFHVFLGTLMLLIITLRLQKGHFTPQRHFGFEGVAWYWHFVDVVWLGLYIVVYWM